jgi:hypothetical protein
MVSEIRVPSSSSSNSYALQSVKAFLDGPCWCSGLPTNCGGLDLHALLNVCNVCVVRVLVFDDLLAAKGVHEGGPP